MAKKPPPAVKLPFTPGDPRRTSWFKDARFGMIIHWGVYSIPARGEWVMQQEEIPLKQYEKYFRQFNPTRYDPREWARLAKEAGMKYMVLTTKHHDGFCLFDSKLTDYKATNTKARRDLIREYVEAARAEGLKVGFYYSLLDWHHPHYTVDSIHALRNDAKARAEKRDWLKYRKYLHGQVTELMSRYGPIDVLWADFSYGEKGAKEWGSVELLRKVFKLQPKIMVNNRLDVAGDIETPEQRIPKTIPQRDGRRILWESGMTFNDHWGYAREDHNYKSAAQAIRMLADCVSKNGNLMLNVGPQPDGRIPRESASRLKQIGRWMRANGESIYGCADGPTGDLPYGRTTRKGDTLYLHAFYWPADGRLELPPFNANLLSARLLKDGAALAFRQNKSGIVIRGPKSAPDKADAVVALRFDRAPASCGELTRTRVPTVTVPRTKGKDVVLDGHIDPAAWKGAATLEVTLRSGVLTSIRAIEPGAFGYRVRLMHRGEVLYVAVEARRKGGVLLADEEVLDGDGIELLADAALDGRWITNNRSSFRLAIDARGRSRVQDERPAGSVFYRAAASIKENIYTVTAALPFASLVKSNGKPVRAGDEIGFNLCAKSFRHPNWVDYELWWQASGGNVVIDRSQWGRLKLAK